MTPDVEVVRLSQLPAHYLSSIPLAVAVVVNSVTERMPHDRHPGASDLCARTIIAYCCPYHAGDVDVELSLDCLAPQDFEDAIRSLANIGFAPVSLGAQHVHRWCSHAAGGYRTCCVSREHTRHVSPCSVWPDELLGAGTARALDVAGVLGTDPRCRMHWRMGT